MQVELRKLQNNLVVTGSGLIIFGLWSMIKALMMFLFLEEFIRLILDSVAKEKSSVFAVYIVLSVLMILIFLIYLYTGLCARSDGFGKKNRYVYIGIAILLAVLQVISIVSSFINISSGEYAILEIIVTLIVDVSLLYLLLDMIISAFRVKIIRKRSRSGKEAA